MVCTSAAAYKATANGHKGGARGQQIQMHTQLYWKGDDFDGALNGTRPYHV
jgi:hypothetical protein